MRLLAHCSIHPQGWVPIETRFTPVDPADHIASSIHPQGWVPIETADEPSRERSVRNRVAFTPKGGCPLKLSLMLPEVSITTASSIHPQGWVPIETKVSAVKRRAYTKW